MSYVHRHVVTVTTPTTASSTSAFTSEPITGRIAHIIYASSTGAAYATTVDFTIEGEETGNKILVVANPGVAGQTFNPITKANYATTGATGSAGSEQGVYIANERIKVAVAQAGLAKSGTFTFIVA